MSDRSGPAEQFVETFSQKFHQLQLNVEQVILGKSDTVRLALVALFSEGHVLLEDVPGTGKTSLAKTIGSSITGKMTRVQFTPDLLPADVTGGTMYNQRSGGLEFHPGPVFANIVLGDEINRASPKTQSALLEVMEEQQVTVDSLTYPVPRPFMVIATQNPIEFEGTYRLPEAQLDRFLMKLSLGQLSRQSEVEVLGRHGQASTPVVVSPVIDTDQVRLMIRLLERVHVEESVREYIVDVAHATRELPHVRVGASTRACLALQRAARVHAAANHRPFVTPDDVKYLAEAVLGHRLVLTPEAEMRNETGPQMVARVLNEVSAPKARR